MRKIPLTIVHSNIDKSKGKFSQNFVDFSEYMNFKSVLRISGSFFASMSKVKGQTKFNYIVVLTSKRKSKSNFWNKMIEITNYAFFFAIFFPLKSVSWKIQPPRLTNFIKLVPGTDGLNSQSFFTLASSSNRNVPNHYPKYFPL